MKTPAVPDSSLHEVRALPSSGLRVDQVDGRRTIVGYAAVWDVLSEDLGGFREVIRRGAFTEALAASDVRLVVNHDPSSILGRTASGTLRLFEDERGLRYEADPPDTQTARDVLVSIERGDLSGSSFRFFMFDDPTLGQAWRATPDGVVRELTRFRKVDDVSIVTYPAYRATDVSVRSLDLCRRAAGLDRSWEDAALMRLRLAESA